MRQPRHQKARDILQRHKRYSPRAQQPSSVLWYTAGPSGKGGKKSVKERAYGRHLVYDGVQETAPELEIGGRGKCAGMHTAASKFLRGGGMKNNVAGP